MPCILTIFPFYKPFANQDYDKPYKDAYCINTRPLPVDGSRPLYDTMLDCCKGSYSGQISDKCFSMLPIGQRPTSSPTTVDAIVGFFYPEYEKSYSKGTCSNARPLPFPNENDRPNYPTQLECCLAEYSAQTSGACIQDLPIGLRPTSSPTKVEGPELWYNPQNGGWGNSVCENTLPKPSSATASYPSKMMCCDNTFGGQTSNACYCWASNCTEGVDVCTGTSGDIGCESCYGDNACAGASGNIGGSGCRNCGSCRGTNSCKSSGARIGKSSCIEESACEAASGVIGDGSCSGDLGLACKGQSGMIGDRSCTSGNNDDGLAACNLNTGTIGNDSCAAHGSCSFNIKIIGNGSCNSKDACGSLLVNVGKNSCNRLTGCSICTGTDVPDDQCNDGINQSTGNPYPCPASCG